MAKTKKKKDSESNSKKSPSNPDRSNNRVFWITFSFILSIWTFILGVLVGRGSSPVEFDIQKFEKELQSLITKDIDQEKQKYFPDNKKNNHHVQNLEFHEKLKKKFIADPPQPKKKPKSIKNKPSAKPKKRVEKKSVTKTTEVPKKKISRRSFEQKKPSTSVKKANIILQVASFSNLKDANIIIDRLRKKGYSAFRTSGEVAGKTWYRVRIGGFKNRQAAEELKHQLEKEKYKPMILSLKGSP